MQTFAFEVCGFSFARTYKPSCRLICTPRIDYWDARGFKRRYIPRRNGKVAGCCYRSNQSIRYWDWMAVPSCAGDNLRIKPGRIKIKRQDPAFKQRDDLLIKMRGKSFAALSGGQAFNAKQQLSEADSREIKGLRNLRVKPFEHSRLRSRPHRFRNHVSVEQNH